GLGKLVASPYDFPIPPGWNIISDPFMKPIEISALQFKIPLNVGGVPAGTLLTMRQARELGVVNGPVYGFSTAASRYTTATTLQPMQAYWIYFNPNVTRHRSVTIRFTSPSGP
ncbi:MAG: hypothetical protein LC772_05205, partial [Chloroflexi bacterium]|nr:hypothetical protein [Chloroflexota bacterium]